MVNRINNTMTQEEKIKKLEELVFNCQHGDDDEFLDTEYLIELFLDWHTTELNRKVEEVVRVYADKIKADINNGVEYNKKNYNRDEITKEQIFAYLDHWLHDLKALLNVVNADD